MERKREDVESFDWVNGKWWKDNIKMDDKETSCEVMNWMVMRHP